MDLVTIIAGCAIGLRSELFVPLGSHGDCARAAAIGAEPMRDQRSTTIDRWTTEIAAASLRFGIPDRVLRAVMRAESGGVPSITSSAGAMGLMQLMPETWATMRTRYRLGADPYAPADNTLAGAGFLRELIDRYGAPDFLAAYNAGPGRLDDHRLRGRALPNETRRYVAQLASITQDLPGHTRLPPLAPPRNDSAEPIVASSTSIPARDAARSNDTDGSLFVMDENADARCRVLSDTPISRSIASVPMPSTRPNGRDGGAIFAPVGGSTAAPPPSAATLHTE